MNVNRVYLDSNIPMYAAGRPHPLRDPAVGILQAAADGRVMAVTGVEVFQEILHRYRHIGAPETGLALFDAFHKFMGDGILATTPADISLARSWLEDVAQLDARDALHLAVMQNNGIHTIVSADRVFARAQSVRWIALQQWAMLLDE